MDVKIRATGGLEMTPRCSLSRSPYHRFGRCAGFALHPTVEKEPERRPASAENVRERLRQVPLREPWTPEQAEAWWKENEASVFAARGGSGGTTTIA